MMIMDSTCASVGTTPKRVTTLFTVEMPTFRPLNSPLPSMRLRTAAVTACGATLGAISWFYVMKKDELLDAVNTGSGKLRGNLWYSVGRYVYVPLAVILCCVALFMHVAF